jgi:hypothetical protein
MENENGFESYRFKSQQMLDRAFGSNYLRYCEFDEATGGECPGADCNACKERFVKSVIEQIDTDVFSELVNYEINGRNVFSSQHEINRLENENRQLRLRITDLRHENERIRESPPVQQALKARERGMFDALAEVEDAIDRIRCGNGIHPELAERMEKYGYPNYR